jgi:hypothetical protein
VAAKVLTYFCPQTWSNNQITNRSDIHHLERPSVKATVVSAAGRVVRARLDGNLKMKHSPWNLQANQNGVIEATLIGFMDFDPAKKIRTLRLVTAKATYEVNHQKNADFGRRGALGAVNANRRFSKSFRTIALR